MRKGWIQLAAARNSGVAAFGTVGTAIDGRQVGPSSNAGLWFAPFYPPLTWDKSRPIEAVALLSPQTAGAGGNIIIEVVTTVATAAAGPATDNTFLVTFTTPNPWPVGQIALVPLIQPAASTFNAFTWAPNNALGIRVQRLGLDPNDTFAQTLIIGAALRIEFTPTCKANCCL